MAIVVWMLSVEIEVLYAIKKYYTIQQQLNQLVYCRYCQVFWSPQLLSVFGRKFWNGMKWDLLLWRIPVSFWGDWWPSKSQKNMGRHMQRHSVQLEDQRDNITSVHTRSVRRSVASQTYSFSKITFDFRLLMSILCYGFALATFFPDFI